MPLRTCLTEQAPPPEELAISMQPLVSNAKAATKAQKPMRQRHAPVDANAARTKLSQEGKMDSQERKLEHGLQVMLDILTDYLGNSATRGEWIIEIQKRFIHRNKLRRGWSDDRIDARIRKLEEMGLIAGGRGFGAYWSATDQARQTSLLEFASDANASMSATVRKPSANESFRDVLNAAKLQLLRGGKSSVA
jgi:hypothetical protein